MLLEQLHLRAVSKLLEQLHLRALSKLTMLLEELTQELAVAPGEEASDSPTLNIPAMALRNMG